MQYNQLNTTSQKSKNRKGRGTASGSGKTSGRGTKGQNSRSGGGVRPGFEGGQNPLIQRIPKLSGFRSRAVKPNVIYTAQLNNFSKTVDNKTLVEAGLIDSEYSSVKVISKGELKSKVDVKVAKASKSAIEAITKAGGSFTETQPPKREKLEKKK